MTRRRTWRRWWDGRTKGIFIENLPIRFQYPGFRANRGDGPTPPVSGVLVDNTFGMAAWLLRPVDWGCNVVIHSATKWICGQRYGPRRGVVVDGGNFDWDPEKYPLLAAPSESYHGVVYTDVFGKAALCRTCEGWTGCAISGRLPSPFQLLPDAAGTGDPLAQGGAVL